MRLSVFFDHAKVAAQKHGDNIRDILRRFRAAGIETAELALRDVTDDTLALLRNAGLRVGAVYRSFDFTGAFDPSDGGFLRAPLVAGATHLLALPCLLRPENRPDAFARTIEGLRAVASLCRDAGLVPMIENFGDTRSPTCRPGDIARILDAIECFGAADMLSAVLSSARFLQGLDGKETPCLTT